MTAATSEAAPTLVGSGHAARASDPGRRALRHLDLLFAVTLVAVLAATFCLRPRMPLGEEILAAGAGLLLALAWIRRHTREGSLRAAAGFRVGYGYLHAGFLYNAVDRLLRAADASDAAPTLAGWDRVVCFGSNPHAQLDAVSSPWLTEILQWAYNLYWLVPATVLVSLVARGPQRQLPGALLAVVLSLVITFLGFLALPAAGPLHHCSVGPASAGPAAEAALYSFQSDLPGVFAAEWLRSLMATADTTRLTTLPSGHVTSTLVAWWLALGFSRRFAWALAPLVVALVSATVYLRYHYVVDVLVAVPVAALALALTRPARRAASRSLAVPAGSPCTASEQRGSAIRSAATVWSR